ncbi:MAG TPA: hypothetical protein DCP90_01455 [Clostridiales bacterium]|nr:MAG: hypothetical protein A2Y22_05385 [Clostridiales bacterium GWD2_32_59]HAN09262.1 hypothetical protein [Clostridiales bacterium]
MEVGRNHRQKKGRLRRLWDMFTVIMIGGAIEDGEATTEEFDSWPVDEEVIEEWTEDFSPDAVGTGEKYHKDYRSSGGSPDTGYVESSPSNDGEPDYGNIGDGDLSNG